MSAVRDYYRDHPSWNDDLHKLLDREPGLLAQLPGLRARALACCGAEPSKNGEIRLVVADPAGWDAIAKEQAVVQGKLDAISRAVAEIDAIFAEVEEAGIEIDRKTPSRLWKSAPRTDLPPQPGEYVNAHGKRCDKNGIPIKSQIDPRFLAWNERAKKALKEAQAVVG
jgi:hypothetical protein